MRKLLSALVVLAACPLAALAQPGPVDPAKVLAPYVDESTYAVGVVDVQNIDIDSLLGRLGKLGAPKEEVAHLKRMGGQIRDDLLRAGGRHVCFTLNMDNRLDDGPLLVVAVAKGGNAQGVADALEKLPGNKVKIKGDTVLAGSANTLERALERKPGAAPEIAAALAGVEAMPTRLAFTVPAAFRKALEESMPNLPKELGGGPITPVSRGLTWGAIGLNLSADKLQLRGVVQTKDATAATDLGRLADLFLEMLRTEALKDEAPDQFKGLQLLRPELKGEQLRLALDAKALDTAILPLFARVREAAMRAQSINNLKQIGLAMHGYHDVYKSFPAQGSYDKEKKPLLSWRVHVLPYLDQETLYKEFKLDEPWDSEHNKELIARIPAVFASPLMKEPARGKTTYLVPAGPDMIFNGAKKVKIQQITDGTSNTILAVDAADSAAVWWTQPADYAVDRKKPKADLLRPGAAGILALFADGSVRVLPRALRDEIMWFYFHPNDGNAIPND